VKGPIVLSVLLVSLHGAEAPSDRSAIPGVVAPMHRDVLQTWLGTRPQLRVLDDADCHCEDSIAEIQAQAANVPYHSYFATGGPIGTGVEDSAVIASDTGDRGRRSSRTVAIFRGPFRSRARAAFVGRVVALNDALDLNGRGRLVIAPTERREGA